MGLSIYYKGRIKAAEALPGLIEELTDIAIAHNWSHHTFFTELKNSDFNKEEFDDEIYGILISPPECEPIFMTFLSNGVMCSPIALEHYLETNDKVLMGTLFTKTQYAGPLVHQQVVLLLDYINSKYLEDFELTDETGYWNHRDEKILNEKFEEMRRILNFVTGALQKAELKPGETLEDFFQNLLIKFKGKKTSD